jgi:hypothetical protein
MSLSVMLGGTFSVGCSTLMPLNFSVWTTDLLAAGICGLIGGTIGSYFKGYSSRKGENRANYEDLPSLLKQEFARAFEQEAGKRLATHQDVENVIHEIRTVTKETETIKAQIGADLWTRQMAWQQKREIYLNILKFSHAFQDAIGTMHSALTVYQQHVYSATGSLENQNIAWSQVKSSLTEYNRTQRQFLEVLIEAQIFVSPVVTDHLRKAQGNRHFLGVFEGLAQPAEPGAGQKSLEQATQFLVPWTAHMVTLARRDLGVD